MEGSFDFFLGGGEVWKIWSLQESPPINEANVFSRKGRCMIWSLSNMKFLVLQDSLSNALALPPKNVK